MAKLQDYINALQAQKEKYFAMGEYINKVEDKCKAWEIQAMVKTDKLNDKCNTLIEELDERIGACNLSYYHELFNWKLNELENCYTEIEAKRAMEDWDKTFRTMSETMNLAEKAIKIAVI